MIKKRVLEIKFRRTVRFFVRRFGFVIERKIKSLCIDVGSYAKRFIVSLFLAEKSLHLVKKFRNEINDRTRRGLVLIDLEKLYITVCNNNKCDRLDCNSAARTAAEKLAARL